MVQLAIFASGTGSNALSLLEENQKTANVAIPVVIVDQANSPLLKTIPEKFPRTQVELVELPEVTAAKEARVSRRVLHEKVILEILKKHQIEWCFLAGYMRVLSPFFIQQFTDKEGNSRMVNIHPSRLPDYPGVRAYERAFQAGETTFGITLHFVDETLDGGKVIRQEIFAKKQGESLSSLMERGKQLEWKIYRELLQELDQKGTLHVVA